MMRVAAERGVRPVPLDYFRNTCNEKPHLL
jgi:hypothetical protein